MTRYSREIPMQKLLEYPLIIYDISSLASEQDQYLFGALQLTRWFLYTNHFELPRHLCFIVDEGEFLFSKDRTESSYLPITRPENQFIQRGRKRNLRLVVGTQFPRNLCDELLNPSMLAAMKLSSYYQQEIVAHMLGLTREEFMLLDDLKPREALVRI